MIFDCEVFSVHVS